MRAVCKTREAGAGVPPLFSLNRRPTDTVNYFHGATRYLLNVPLTATQLRLLTYCVDHRSVRKIERRKIEGCSDLPFEWLAYLSQTPSVYPTTIPILPAGLRREAKEAHVPY